MLVPGHAREVQVLHADDPRLGCRAVARLVQQIAPPMPDLKVRRGHAGVRLALARRLRELAPLSFLHLQAVPRPPGRGALLARQLLLRLAEIPADGRTAAIGTDKQIFQTGIVADGCGVRPGVRIGRRSAVGSG
jgi:hypothetical protein